ncbi:hypothetical protein BU14_0075s0016 [Porphyra umbilicalis]|uniref:Aminomethyltransferase folate-binding domain-containing protein n=1 Tax=Porphyra umbilicalis TaxID=2786 RepID=A0A1X6PFL0_PORUM|nr:hypothetical protein BU14_0075s0016 [Porphyra umbilicalis]|eukprot:OSX79526.1 hypothetical protein BU14_0075s0016 [Porphyra umbilicalis]
MAPIVGCRLTSRAVLRVAGRDARALLQSLLTADVGVVDPHPPPPLVATALLTRRGRVAFDALVASPAPAPAPPAADGGGRRPDAGAVVFLDVAADRADDAVAHLRRHRVRAKVDIADVSADVGVFVAAGGHVGYGGEGGGTSDPLAALTARPAAADEVVGVDPRVPALGVRAVAAVDAPPLVRGVRPPDGRPPPPPPPGAVTAETAWTLLRMLHGVPEGAADFPPPRDAPAPAAAPTGGAPTGGSSGGGGSGGGGGGGGNGDGGGGGGGDGDAAAAGRLPLEMNLDRLGAISFAKGCYLGQELTARAHHTGVTRRRLVPLLLLPPALTDGGGGGGALASAALPAAVAAAAAAAAAGAVAVPGGPSGCCAPGRRRRRARSST